MSHKSNINNRARNDICSNHLLYFIIHNLNLKDMHYTLHTLQGIIIWFTLHLANGRRIRDCVTGQILGYNNKLSSRWKLSTHVSQYVSPLFFPLQYYCSMANPKVEMIKVTNSMSSISSWNNFKQQASGGPLLMFWRASE